METDPKRQLSSQQFIGILKEEYFRQQQHASKSDAINQVVATGRSLSKHIGASWEPNRIPRCRQCGQRNHKTENCLYLQKNKCTICGKYGHLTKNCWDRNKPKRRREDGKSWEDNSNKKIKRDQVNVAEEENQIVVYDLDE